MVWACDCLVLDRCQTCAGHGLGTHVLAMSRTYIGDVITGCWTCVWNILDMLWICFEVCFVLDFDF